MDFHVEVYIASRLLGREQGSFRARELINRVRQEFQESRRGVDTHVHTHCVANSPLNQPRAYNYLWRIEKGLYRCFDPAQDTPHPDRVGGMMGPDIDDTSICQE